MSNDGMWAEENRGLRLENERLRERVKNLGIDIERKIVTITRQRERIERLRADNQALQELRDSAMKLYGKANERIEELEESHEILRKEIDFCCDNHQGNHFVTTEQIDAAWKSAGEFDNGIEVLENLGIVRCRGCEDSLKPGTVFKMDMGERGYITDCPGCAKFTGHGWVIGGDDERQQSAE